MISAHGLRLAAAFLAVISAAGAAPSMKLEARAQLQSKAVTGLFDPILRQSPLTSYCLLKDVIATPDDLSQTFNDFCTSFTSTDHLFHTGDIYSSNSTFCNGTRCIVMSIGYDCAHADGSSATGIMSFAECVNAFSVPVLPNPVNSCVKSSGGYLGGSAPQSCWTALSVVTPPDKSEVAQSLTFPDDFSSTSTGLMPNMDSQDLVQGSSRRTMLVDRDADDVPRALNETVKCFSQNSVKANYTRLHDDMTDFCAWFPSTPGSLMQAGSTHNSGTRYFDAERSILFTIKYEEGCEPLTRQMEGLTCDGFFSPIISSDCGPVDGMFGGGQVITSDNCLRFTILVIAGKQ